MCSLYFVILEFFKKNQFLRGCLNLQDFARRKLPVFFLMNLNVALNPLWFDLLSDSNDYTRNFVPELNMKLGMLSLHHGSKGTHSDEGLES